MTQVLLRPAASADIEDAFAWYERRRPGLGLEFLDSIQSAVDTLGISPSAFPIVHRDTRRMLVRRFPYAVFYRKVAGKVIVIACMHASRHPLHWKTRI